MRETFRQYTDRWVREAAQRCGVTMREVRETIDLNWLRGEWFTEITDRASGGQIIDARTLDSLTEGERYRVLHDYPRAIPDGYMPRQVRLYWFNDDRM